MISAGVCRPLTTSRRFRRKMYDSLGHNVERRVHARRAADSPADMDRRPAPADRAHRSSLFDLTLQIGSRRGRHIGNVQRRRCLWRPLLPHRRCARAAQSYCRKPLHPPAPSTGQRRPTSLCNLVPRHHCPRPFKTGLPCQIPWRRIPSKALAFFQINFAEIARQPGPPCWLMNSCENRLDRSIVIVMSRLFPSLFLARFFESGEVSDACAQVDFRGDAFFGSALSASAKFRRFRRRTRPGPASGVLHGAVGQAELLGVFQQTERAGAVESVEHDAVVVIAAEHDYGA